MEEESCEEGIMEEASGRHLGGFWEASGTYGAIWAKMACGSENIATPLEPNAKIALKFQFYEGFLMVGVTK